MTKVPSQPELRMHLTEWLHCEKWVCNPAGKYMYKGLLGKVHWEQYQLKVALGGMWGI